MFIRALQGARAPTAGTGLLLEHVPKIQRTRRVVSWASCSLLPDFKRHKIDPSKVTVSAPAEVGCRDEVAAWQMDEDECTSLSSGDAFCAITGGSQEGAELIGPQVAVENERPGPGDQDLDSPRESESSGGNHSSSMQDWWPQSSGGSGQASSEEWVQDFSSHKEDSLPKEKPMRLIGEGDGVDGPPVATLSIHSWDYWLNILHITVPEPLAETLEDRKSKKEILDVQLGVLARLSSFEAWRRLSFKGESVIRHSYLLDNGTLKSGVQVYLVSNVLRVRHIVWLKQRRIDLVRTWCCRWMFSTAKSRFYHKHYPHERVLKHCGTG